jgi:hypothetical protein
MRASAYVEAGAIALLEFGYAGNRLVGQRQIDRFVTVG